jgi:hypothetical protein
MDPVVITTLVIAIGSLATSILTHIKYSSCCGFRIEAYHEEQQRIRLSKQASLVVKPPVENLV